ncbi:hypothetical protein BDV96DRAFT_578251 [Lophiotrema nucula]|uniref:Heterokaryon incompatibility domain-containing protein n=1 Tax=Lophiotrema nucula TaxID=690887 RepID=A0A6A5Z5V2_9PLEO|nr:hypothetical protein BDV96DRAFT_578251 [Lophiotrema nucula]
MRLINCKTLELEEFIGPTPYYAILSHTWEKHELSYKDYVSPGPLHLKNGSSKILKTCEVALGDGLLYAWIDTCCI